MSNFDNTNRGSIWKNEEKKSENQPDFNGSLNVTVTAGMTNYKNEVIVDDVEKYLIKDNIGKVVGFKMEFFVNNIIILTITKPIKRKFTMYFR